MMNRFQRILLPIMHILLPNYTITLGQFESLMSTRENIRLIARTPSCYEIIVE